MWPFKKSASKLNRNVELALSIEQLDKARQYFVVATLETMLPAKDDRQKMIASMNSLYAKNNPFMQPGSSSFCLGAMMSDEFSCKIYETAFKSVLAGVNRLFSLTDLLTALKKKRKQLEKEAHHCPTVTPGQLNPPWNDRL